MGYITFNGTDKLVVKLESCEDRAALRAALKAIPGTDESESTEREDTLQFDHDNPSNVLAFWAAEFDWDSKAIRIALDQLAPLAWQQVGLHSGVFHRINKREKKMFAGLTDMAQKKREELGCK